MNKKKDKIESIMERDLGITADDNEMQADYSDVKQQGQGKGSSVTEQNSLLCADYERMQGGQEDAPRGEADPSQLQLALPDQMVKTESQILRQDMTISTLDFNSKEGQIIPVDDDETYNVIAPYLHTPEEAQLREIIWKEQNAEYLRELK